MCDFSSNITQFETDLIPELQTFTKKWLDVDGSEHSISLEEWVGTHSSPGSDLILQMDIEGAEYRNLIATSEYCIQRFRIIIIELHGLSSMSSMGEEYSPIEQLITKLGKTHTVVHAHPNNCCGYFIDRTTSMNIPRVIEVTYLRNDRYQQNTKYHYDPEIPNPLDISANVLGKPPIHLNAHWNIKRHHSNNSLAKIKKDNQIFEREVQKRLKNDLSASRDNNLAINNVYSHINIGYSSGAADFPHPSSSLDVAFGKPFYASSNYHGTSRHGVVSSRAPYFFHTCIEERPWITIDLLGSFLLHELIISNRTDGFRERAQFLLYSIDKNPRHWNSSAYPVNISPTFFLPRSKESRTPLLGQRARYLTIFSPCITALHFSELKILQKH
jgi:hypothetical protein